MTIENFWGKTLSKKIATAYRVHPDFRKTRLGPYKRNAWTGFADKALIVWSGLERGLTMANYDNWLSWSYEIFARDEKDNPITRRVFDLRDDDREIGVLWAMSFKEKSFPCKKRVDMPDFKFRKSSFVDKEKEFFTIEKELIADRFGNPALVQRRYSDEHLVELVTITSERPGGNVLIMRLDNPKVPGYQQWYSNFIVGTADKLNSFINIRGDISTHLLETRHLQASYMI